MKTIRYELAAAIVWLFLLFNAERLHAPLNIASFTYVFAAALALAMLLSSWLQAVKLAWVAAGAVAVFIAAKGFVGHEIAGAALPLTVTEVCALLITLVLARRIAHGLTGVEQAIASALVDQVDAPAVPFELGQSDIYREIRRARRFSRPLSLLAITIGDATVRAAFHQLIERIQRDNVKRYITAQVGRVIAEQTKDCDIVTRRDDHFVIGLPETTEHDARDLSLQLLQAVEDRFGVAVHVGIATFPDQEVTFERLLAHAELDMRSNGYRTVDKQADKEGTTVASSNGATNGRHAVGT